MILAVVVAVVCGGASVEVATSRPAVVAPIVAEPDVVVVPTAVPPSAAASPRQSASPVADPTFPTISPRASAPLPGPPPATEQGTSLEPDLVLLGSWTVDYVVGPGNGNGANITIPLHRLDGRTIKPGASFDFWTALGEVSLRTGYRRGAIIVGHRIDPDGALAGGICTVSTALFNAAARAGLQITARRSHGGYLAKYPLGLDAAVAKGDHLRQTLAFRNDTTQPILIRTISTTGMARVDLYGVAPLGRTVEFSKPAISGRQKARDRHIRTTSLKRGEQRRIEDRSDGMTVVVKRTVLDADGQVLHRDRWVSRYRWLGGTVLDGIG